MAAGGPMLAHVLAGMHLFLESRVHAHVLIYASPFKKNIYYLLLFILLINLARSRTMQHQTQANEASLAEYGCFGGHLGRGSSRACAGACRCYVSPFYII